MATMDALNDAPWLAAPWARLLAAWRGGRLGHGLLFAGTPGLGQGALADRLAALILCEAPAAEAACGHCRGCRLRLAGTHPDLQRVGLLPRDDGRLKTEIGVEQVRQLGQWFALTPQFGRGQVALIDPADKLNLAAANAVLKTLEEPAEARYLLLVAGQPQRLPATVRSRCQRIELGLPAAEEARAFLLAQGHPAGAALRALQFTDGHPGEALQLLQENGLARCEEIASQLAALAQGRASASGVAQQWLADDGEARLHLLARLLRRAGWQRHGIGDAGLTLNTDFHKLAAWSRRVDQVRALYSAPLRHELLLTDLFQEWRGLHRS
jgi:DNA polymerase III subunit delta'